MMDVMAKKSNFIHRGDTAKPATVAGIASIERQLLSVEECFAITGLSTWWWRRAAASGKVSSVKPCGHRGKLLIPRSEVDRVIKEATRPRVA